MKVSRKAQLMLTEKETVKVANTKDGVTEVSESCTIR